MTMLSGREAGKILCDLLGIPSEKVKSIIISCTAGCAARVTILQYLTGEQLDGVKTILKKYDLVEKED